jgi:AcrR family transcriptional regulator
MRDIADKVGIKVASIYNHFESKVKILEYAYQYYDERQYDNRKPIDEMKKMIETASMEELVPTFFYTFVTEDRKKYTRMILITKIIYMRLFLDPLANTVFADKIANNTEYVMNILKHGVKIGRLDPAFDMQAFADVLVGSLVSMGINAFANINYQIGPFDQEKPLLAILAQLLATALK